MLVSFNTSSLLKDEAIKNSVIINKLDTIEPDVLVQGDLTIKDDKFLIYPRFTSPCPYNEKKSFQTSLIGITSMKLAKSVGDTGFTFSHSVYCPDGRYKHQYIRCIAFGTTADYIKKYLYDKPALLDGKFSFNCYNGKVSMELLVSGFGFIPNVSNQDKTGAKSTTTVQNTVPVNNEQIPF
jgi:hypothetical protein